MQATGTEKVTFEERFQVKLTGSDLYSQNLTFSSLEMPLIYPGPW
jgi:hypothetical protein